MKLHAPVGVRVHWNTAEAEVDIKGDTEGTLKSAGVEIDSPQSFP